MCTFEENGMRCNANDHTVVYGYALIAPDGTFWNAGGEATHSHIAAHHIGKRLDDLLLREGWIHFTIGVNCLYIAQENGTVPTQPQIDTLCQIMYLTTSPTVVQAIRSYIESADQ